jgi:hypothetical protein
MPQNIDKQIIQTLMKENPGLTREKILKMAEAFGEDLTTNEQHTAEEPFPRRLMRSA